MEWVSRAVSGNTSAVLWETLQDTSSHLGKLLLERLVLPLGQSTLLITERAVQYTLNGEYEAVQEVTRRSVDGALSWLDLTSFQVKLLREFSVIFLGNSLLVLLAWRVYGRRIRQKFMEGGPRGQGQQSLQELRTSLSQLKLPQEMDFKFK